MLYVLPVSCLYKSIDLVLSFYKYKFLFANEASRNILLELAMHKGKIWKNGKKLKVKFLGGTKFLQQNVIKYAKQWEKFANIEFNFIPFGDAEIRIAFVTGGSWSYVGTDALNITDQSEPTMNFGWFEISAAFRLLSK